MTNRQALEYAIANLDNAEVVDKLKTMVVALDKKSANRKPTAQQEQNEKFKVMIMEYLQGLAGEGKTVTEIQNAIPELNPSQVTNQRVSAIIRTMVDAGQVQKYVEKRKSYFAVA